MSPWEPPLLLIQWRDACADTEHWETASELRPDDKQCLTVGWLAYEDSQCVILVQTKGVDDDHVGSKWEIPKPWIKSRIVLEKGGAA